MSGERRTERRGRGTPLRDGDTGLGIPPPPGLAGGRSGTPATGDAGGAAAAAGDGAVPPGPSRRDGGPGLGIPPPTPAAGARKLSEEETERHVREQAKAEYEAFEERLRDTAAGSGLLLPPPVIAAVTWLGWTTASLLGLVLVAAGVGLAGEIRALPTPADWIAGVAAGLCAALLAAAVLRLAAALIRLRRSPTVPLRALETLQQRERWRRLARERTVQARNELREYLRGYAFDEAARRRLADVGVTDEQCDALSLAREFLLRDQGLPPDTWVAEFARRFQSILDEAAAVRVKTYARRVGWGTFLAPMAVIDQFVVSYSCLAMVKDVMILFGLRPAAGQAATILARSILHAYLSGLLQELTESGADAVWEEIADSVQEAASPVAARLMSGAGVLTREGAAKTSEGVLNGWLVWRLGRRTIRLLQPVRTAD